MRKLVLLFTIFFSVNIGAQNLDGSWKLATIDDEEVVDMEVVRIITNGYFSDGAKRNASNEFLYAQGGEYDLEAETATFDFHTENPDMVGKIVKFEMELDDENTLSVETEEEEQIWTRISVETNDLTGNWVITGRERNGEMGRMTPGDRRTIKILAGDRFQWVAFNSATGEFSGTGGGMYTAENGKYTENIEFFSRDDSRVGASLGFDYEVKDGEWHHSGKSSKGDPIYEIWSPYAEAYQN